MHYIGPRNNKLLIQLRK